MERLGLGKRCGVEGGKWLMAGVGDRTGLGRTQTTWKGLRTIQDLSAATWITR